MAMCIRVGSRTAFWVCTGSPSISPTLPFDLNAGAIPTPVFGLMGVPFWDGEKILVGHYVSADFDGLFVDPAMIVKPPAHYPSDN